MSRRARIVNDRLVCAACVEGTAGKQPARDGTRKRATGVGARPVTGPHPAGSGTRPAVARPAAREGRGGGPAAVAAAALAAGVIGAGLIYLYGYRPAARIPPAEHAKGVAAKKAEDAREASAGTANPAIVAEERARADYDELVRFEGLDPSDKDGKIARIRAYLAKHGNTIQAARARKLMEDIAAGGPAQAPLPSPGSDGRHAAEKPLRRDTSGSRDADSREPVSKTADRPATQDGVASTSSPATGTGSGIGTGSSGTGTKAPDAGPSGPDTRKRPSNPEARPAEPAKTAAKPEDRTPGPESQAAAPGGREAIGEGKTASAAARAVFLDELMGLLRKRDTAGAEALLKKAAQDPAFAAGHPTAASYARMTAWADALDRAVAAALEKLKESGDLEAELRTTRGATMKVGGEGAYRIVSVADGILMVAGRGVTVPVPIDQLTNGTREELARLALPLDGRGWLLRAFAAMLAADPAAGTPAVRAREDIVKAAEAGAQAEDVELLKALLPA
ncbi:MAG: hypothetical protein N3A38_15515, partial [Planctomycetota bacterium]|nr:hypothetical protein [Planctomycetota bacterium]